MRWMAALARRLAPILLAVSLLAVFQDAHAQQRPNPPAAPQSHSGKVDVQLMVVYAHNEDNKTDADLKPVMQNLRFLRFSGYRLQDKFGSPLAINQESTYNIVGGRKLKLKLLSRDEKQAKVRVRMYKSDEKVLDTTVSIHRHKSFMLGGPKHDKGVLVFAVTVEY